MDCEHGSFSERKKCLDTENKRRSLQRFVLPDQSFKCSTNSPTAREVLRLGGGDDCPQRESERPRWVSLPSRTLRDLRKSLHPGSSCNLLLPCCTNFRIASRVFHRMLLLVLCSMETVSGLFRPVRWPRSTFLPDNPVVDCLCFDGRRLLCVCYGWKRFSQIEVFFA